MPKELANSLNTLVEKQYYFTRAKFAYDHSHYRGAPYIDPLIIKKLASEEKDGAYMMVGSDDYVGLCDFYKMHSSNVITKLVYNQGAEKE